MLPDLKKRIIIRNNKKKPLQIISRNKQISSNSIRKLAKRAGCKRLQSSNNNNNNSIIPVVRSLIVDFARRITEKSTIYTEHRNAKTVTIADVLAALRSIGRSLYGYDDNHQYPRSIITRRTMTVQKSYDSSSSSSSPLFIIVRHGERIDNHQEDQEPVMKRENRENDGEDPSLTKRGYEKAKNEVANEILEKIRESKKGFLSLKRNSSSSPPIIKVKFLVSPFLRCQQTAIALCDGMMMLANNKSSSSSSSSSSSIVISRENMVIDNRFAEIMNSQIIKHCRDETVGPNFISPPLIPNNNNNNNNNHQLPKFNEETREGAYKRFRWALKGELEAADENEKNDTMNCCTVTIIVTHGDALNACMLELCGQGRVVYNCEYLGHYFVIKKQVTEISQHEGEEGKSIATKKWIVEKATGVDWFDENDL